MANDDFLSQFYGQNQPEKPEKKIKKETEKAPPSSASLPKKTILPADQSAAPVKRVIKKESKQEEPINFEKEFERLFEYHDALQRELESIYSTTGLTPQTIQGFLDNPNNFNTETYQKIQTQRQKLHQELLGKLTPQSKEMLERREKKLMQEKRKKRNIGERRKWMSMD